MEHLTIVIDQLVAEVAEAMAGDPKGIVHDENGWGAVARGLGLLFVLAQAGYRSDSPLHPDVVEEWKKHFMAVWERTIDDLGPSPSFKKERRAVLNRTFDQLTEAAAAQIQ
jgi:hypothetical protein